MPIPESNPRITDPKLPSDQLGSVQRQLQIHIISEGEIEGFPSATGSQGSAEYNFGSQKDIFLNGTQIMQQSANNALPSEDNLNFNNVFTEVRFGTPNQTKIKGFVDTETERIVGLELTQGNAVTQTITNTVDRIRVTIQVDSLQFFKDDGDIVGTFVEHTIKITQNNGTISTPINDKIEGKTPNNYVRDYIIDIPSNFVYPLTLSVERTNPDSSDARLQNKSRFLQFTEIQDKADNFPNTAHAAIRVDAEQFPQSPRVMFRIRGTKIKIPHNATVRADGSLSFSGVFNGSLKAAKEYCNDPAWVLFDLLTNVRFGFGDHIQESMLDKFAFYSASVYNSELILDNEGRNPAPRFSCNAVIQNQSDAFKLIGELCSTMRATAFYSAGTITLTQDRPTDPSYLFTLANVTQEGFNYANSSKTIKFTIINVQYFDMETQEFDYETVEADASLQNKYGIVVKNIKAFAITSRTQAQRLGKWFLYTQENESEVINFTTTIEAGSLVRCGAVIKVVDPVRQNKRRGGRIKSATPDTIIVDDATTATDLDKSNNPKLTVILPTGVVEQRNVVDIIDGVITVSPDLSAAPNPNSIWILENDSLESQLFRVVSVSEVEDTLYQIVGVFHDPDKYDFVENDDPLEDRNITTLNRPVDPPTNLQVEERIVVINNRAVSKIFVTWKQVTGTTLYRVQYRFENGNFISTTVDKTSFEILNSAVGFYEIRVFSLNALRRPSAAPVETSINAVGKTALPANVTNLRMEPVNEKLIRLRWDQSTDVDVTHGGFCRIRHSPKTDGTGTFEKATDIDKLSGNSTQIVVPYIEGEYLIRFQDDTGNLSPSSSSIILDLPDALGSLLVQTRREESDSPKFQGDKPSGKVTFDSSINSIKLTDPAANATGEYEFKDILDLGGVFSLDLKRHIFSEGFYANDLFDQRTALIDTWKDFDGASAVDVNAELLVAVTSSAPSGSSYADSDFSGKTFNTFVNGTYKGRGFKFKCVLTSTDPAQNIKISELGYTATFQRRQEQSATAVASGSGVKNITFDKPFFVGTSTLLGANSNLPSIGITATDNITSGDYFQVTNISSTGFSVHFKNSSNASINRNFNFSAIGFGKGA